MKKLPLLAVVIVLGLVIAGCQPPPPLKSDKYLNDTSLLSGQPCAAPCFHDITVGKTTFVDAVAKVRQDAQFKDVQTQDRTNENPAAAAWSAVSGDPCCQLVENKDTGLVEAILVRVAPNMTIKSIIDKNGPPAYVLTGDYSADESVIQLLYPQTGNIVWVVPGNAESTLEESDPVVAVLYLAPDLLQKQLTSVNLMAWDGFKAYKAYKEGTPISTAEPTVAPAQ
jgi:hypothetical protein